MRIQGPGSSVVVNNSGVAVDGAGSTEISAGATLRVNGALIHLNGACTQFADATKVLQHVHPETGGTTAPGQGAVPSLGTTTFGC